MKFYTKFIKNKIIVRLLLTYCLVIIVGLGATAYFITNSMFKKMVDLDAQYENQVIQKVKLFSEEKYKLITSIFTQLYIPGDSAPSIVQLLNPNNKETNRNESISQYIENICEGNSFITDLMLIDYSRKQTYFSSNSKYRELSFNYDIFNSDFFEMIKKGKNRVGVIPNNNPEYISRTENSYPIITFYLNLYDINNIDDFHKYGAIVLNINPLIFENSNIEFQNKSFGRIFIMNKSGLVFYDSRGEFTGKAFPFYSYGLSSVSDTKSNNKYLINEEKSDKIDLVYVNVVDKKQIYDDSIKDRQNVINIIAICTLIMILFSIVAAKKFTDRIRRLVEHMKVIEDAKLDVQLEIKTNDEIGYLERSFNNMCLRLQQNIEIKNKAELKAKTEELKSLQAQINPHFMFNTLEAIRGFAMINKDKETAKMIHILGNMYRWNLKKQDMFVEIYDELEYISFYLELQEICYRGKFNYEISVDNNINKLGIPKLILQPIIENAIHHGFSERADGGEIKIRGYRLNKDIILEIIDNGGGINEKALNTINDRLYLEVDEDDLYSMGLRNVHQRIKILFGDKYGLDIKSEINIGTTVSVKLPALNIKEMRDNVQGNNS